jgi:hypothetical protein
MVSGTFPFSAAQAQRGDTLSRDRNALLDARYADAKHDDPFFPAA